MATTDLYVASRRGRPHKRVGPVMPHAFDWWVRECLSRNQAVGWEKFRLVRPPDPAGRMNAANDAARQRAADQPDGAQS